MNMKKLTKGGNLQYLAAFIILCMFTGYMISIGKMPSLDFTVLMLGLVIVNVLFGIGFEVKERKK